MIVLHDRHSAGDLLDRIVRLRQGVVEGDALASESFGVRRAVERSPVLSVPARGLADDVA